MESSTNKETVLQHVDVPEINTLLVGQIPKVFSARDVPPKLMITEPDLPPKVNPRFAPVRAMPINNSFNLQNANTTRQNYRFRQSARIKKPFSIDQTKDYITKMNAKLSLYDASHRSKTYVYQSDYEEHYAVPLQKRIEEKITKENYEKFLKKKYDNYKELDENPVPISSDKEPGKIVEITYSTKGLKDPADKFRAKEKQERELITFLMKANGEPLPPEKPPARETLDYKKIEMLQKNRCWMGDNGEFMRSGKRSFKGKMEESVKTLIPTFPEDV